MTRMTRSTAARRLRPGRTLLGAAAVGLAVGVLAPAAPALASHPAAAAPSLAQERAGAGAVHEKRINRPGFGGQECFTPSAAVRTTTRGGRAEDHRDVSPAQARRIEARTARILAASSPSQDRRAEALAASVPVYVHVMAAANGAGDVSDSQIAQQIDVLNQTYAGVESSQAAATEFSFYLAGADRFFNDTWHRDGQSTTYRSQTRQGGANALNIWLVDFDYLGVATFPWDYSSNPSIDGIRVQYSSVPGGGAANYDLGKTATHEAGHWFGLYHTFQGGCTTTNDSVSDTPAQSSATSGCPAGRDSCSLAGLDPIHNYMDYSFDACYDQFTPGQSSRMSSMWSAYRA